MLDFKRSLDSYALNKDNHSRLSFTQLNTDKRKHRLPWIHSKGLAVLFLFPKRGNVREVLITIGV